MLVSRWTNQCSQPSDIRTGINGNRRSLSTQRRAPSPARLKEGCNTGMEGFLEEVTYILGFEGWIGVRHVNELGREKNICKAWECGRPWACWGCKRVSRIAKVVEGMTRFSRARLPRSLCSYVRIELDLDGGGVINSQVITGGSSEQLSSTQGHLPYSLLPRQQQLKSLISRLVSHIQLSLPSLP